MSLALAIFLLFCYRAVPWVLINKPPLADHLLAESPCHIVKSAKRISVSCLNRCDLPKHKCLLKKDICPGKIPSYMGWLYTAKDSPEHQLRCGWRPGHISSSVLQRMAENACFVPCGKCNSCFFGRPCSRPFCQPVTCMPPESQSCASKSCAPCFPGQCSPCLPRSCLSCPPTSSSFPPKNCLSCPPRSCIPCPRCGPKCYPPSPRCPPKTKCFIATCPPPPSYQPCETPCVKPMIRIIRHNGQYNIITKPDDITNHPSGPIPLKYVIDTDELSNDKYAKYSIEAKYNNQHFNYTASQSSFVLDFSPPDENCTKPCPTKSSVCYSCQNSGDPLCPRDAPYAPGHSTELEHQHKDAHENHDKPANEHDHEHKHPPKTASQPVETHENHEKPANEYGQKHPTKTASQLVETHENHDKPANEYGQKRKHPTKTASQLVETHENHDKPANEFVKKRKHPPKTASQPVETHENHDKPANEYGQKRKHPPKTASQPVEKRAAEPAVDDINK